ncbi:hypothetical protein L6R49_27555 [Myxococcota bacterium]|nr:hypothetical protein [Myxococcota bacterium]
MTDPLPALTSAPDPGLRGLMALGGGYTLGKAPTPDGGVSLWLIEGDTLHSLGALPARPLERAHSVEPTLDPLRGRALLPIGDTMVALDLAARRLSAAWSLPPDEDLWHVERAGPCLLARGSALWAWDLERDTLIWTGPADLCHDMTWADDGALLGVTAQEEDGRATLTVVELQSGTTRAQVQLPLGAGGRLGSVTLLRGGEALLCARHGERDGAVFDEVLVHEAGRWRSLGVWSASVTPTPYGLADCARLDDEWIKVAGRDGSGARYSTLIHLPSAAQRPIPHRALLAPGGWALGLDGALSCAATGARGQLSPAPARALCLAPDGRAAAALLDGRVLTWRW